LKRFVPVRCPGNAPGVAGHEFLLHCPDRLN
jgi:hypothetical protein